ncbi:unnamed protein product [marine sediment metagenome]|uniref:Uncharacterized protein n=1 Tax=marine sediment metagenome TaxID=412755 RepID=X1G9M2_9ZZZZ
MSKRSKQGKKQSKKQVKVENPITEKRIIKNDGSPVTTVNVDKNDNLVLTEQDKVKLDKAKALQAKAKQL